MHWETKKFIRLIYCNIHLIVGVWDWAHDTSEVYLYIQSLTKHTVNIERDERGKEGKEEAVSGRC